MLGISILSEITRLITLFWWLMITPVEMVIPINPPLCFAHCALREGQILIIECKNNFIRKPLRLDELRFEYN